MLSVILAASIITDSAMMDLDTMDSAMVVNSVMAIILDMAPVSPAGTIPQPGMAELTAIMRSLAPLRARTPRPPSGDVPVQRGPGRLLEHRPGPEQPAASGGIVRGRVGHLVARQIAGHNPPGAWAALRLLLALRIAAPRRFPGRVLRVGAQHPGVRGALA